MLNLFTAHSLTIDEFELLIPAFEKAFQVHMSKWCIDGKPHTERRDTTYRNCPLPTAEDRLLFILSYMKNNPLQSTHGLLFGMSQGKANGWIHVLLPVLRATLQALGVHPPTSMRWRHGLVKRCRGRMKHRSMRTPPSLFFVMMAQHPEGSRALSVPKMTRPRKRAIVAKKKPYREKLAADRSDLADPPPD